MAPRARRGNFLAGGELRLHGMVTLACPEYGGMDNSISTKSQLDALFTDRHGELSALIGGMLHPGQQASEILGDAYAVLRGRLVNPNTHLTEQDIEAVFADVVLRGRKDMRVMNPLGAGDLDREALRLFELENDEDAAQAAPTWWMDAHALLQHLRMRRTPRTVGLQLTRRMLFAAAGVLAGALLTDNALHAITQSSGTTLSNRERQARQKALPRILRLWNAPTERDALRRLLDGRFEIGGFLERKLSRLRDTILSPRAFSDYASLVADGYRTIHVAPTVHTTLRAGQKNAWCLERAGLFDLWGQMKFPQVRYRPTQYTYTGSPLPIRMWGEPITTLFFRTETTIQGTLDSATFVLIHRTHKTARWRVVREWLFGCTPGTFAGDIAFAPPGYLCPAVLPGLDDGRGDLRNLHSLAAYRDRFLIGGGGRNDYHCYGTTPKVTGPSFLKSVKSEDYDDLDPLVFATHVDRLLLHGRPPKRT